MPSLIKERKRRFSQQHNYKPTAKRLFEAICQVMDVTEDDVRSGCRKSRLVKARAVYAYLGRKFNFTHSVIGANMNRDHASVIHHVKNYNDYLDESKPWFRPEVKEELQEIKRRLSIRLIYCE